VVNDLLVPSRVRRSEPLKKKYGKQAKKAQRRKIWRELEKHGHRKRETVRLG
jgi:hypothetical protein